MSPYHPRPAAEHRRTQRPWLIEALVIASVLGFGYFAITLDDTLWAGSAPGEGSPFAELDWR